MLFFFFSLPSFSSILRMRAFFSLQMFSSSVTENMIFNFISKLVFEVPIFKEHSEADSLTPSFALICNYFRSRPEATQF